MSLYYFGEKKRMLKNIICGLSSRLKIRKWFIINPLCRTLSRKTKNKIIFFVHRNKSSMESHSDNYFVDDSIDESNRFALLYESDKYPSLHSLSLKVLTVPATSSPVEQVFSQSGFLFRQHRGKMSRKMLQMLTMLKINKKFL